MSFLLEGPLILFAPLFLDPHDGDARMGTLKFLSEQLFSPFSYTKRPGELRRKVRGMNIFPLVLVLRCPKERETATRTHSSPKQWWCQF